MGKNSKPNWIKIKNEYLTTKISYRKLAEKYNISFNTLKDRATRESWNSEKQETHHKITTKTQQKTVEKISEKISDSTAEYIVLNNQAKTALEEFFNNQDYKKALVKTKKPFLDKDGNPVFTPKGLPVMIETMEIIDVPYVDPVALRQAIEGIKTTNLTDRLNNRILTEAEIQKFAIENEKLKFESQKLELYQKKLDSQNQTPDEVEDDGFLEALNPQEDWADYEPEAESP